MEEHQMRMCDECQELSRRYAKLKRALGTKEFKDKVDWYQYQLMKRQLRGMAVYLDALIKRIQDTGLNVYCNFNS